MIDHLGVTVSNFERSKAFYLAALAPVGYGPLMEYPGVLGMGDLVKKHPDLWLSQGAPIKIHVAIRAASRAQVDAFYAAAIAAGGTDNGAPGLRPQYHPGYYGAFVLDPDGNNLEAVCHDPNG
ncbi:MAG: VOC family protein [Myxococcota bacterium]